MYEMATVSMLSTSNVDRTPSKVKPFTSNHQSNFSQILSQVQGLADDEKNEDEKINYASLDELIESLGELEVTLTQEDLDQLHRKSEVLPIELRQEFIHVLLENQEPLINQISSWSDEKKLLFLAFSYQQKETQGSRFQGMFEKWINANGQKVMNHSLSSINDPDITFFTDLLRAAPEQVNGQEERERKAMLFVQGMQQEMSGGSPTETDLVERMSKMEQVSMHIGDRLPKEMQQQQFIRQLQSIVKRGTFIQHPQGISTLSIKLYPEHLGRITIQLSQVEGAITARIITGSLVAKELIETQIPQLRQAFNQQQLQVDRIDVSDQHQANEEKEEQSSRENKQNHRQQAVEEEREEPLLFQDLLKEVTINEQV